MSTGSLLQYSIDNTTPSYSLKSSAVNLRLGDVLSITTHIVAIRCDFCEELVTYDNKTLRLLRPESNPMMHGRGLLDLRPTWQWLTLRQGRISVHFAARTNSAIQELVLPILIQEVHL